MALGLGLELGTGVARATSPGLSVETGSPDALCPDLNRTREAVGRRLGALEVPSGRGWRARYTIGHAPEGSPRDFVRLELFAPDGRVRLTRNLPLGSDSCSAMADVIALVLDRYFRSLADHAAPARTRAERTTDPSVTLARPSSSSSSAPPADSGSDSNAANDGPAESGALHAGAEVLATSNGPVVGVHALRELNRNVHVGAGLSLPVMEEAEHLVGGVDVTARSLELRLHAGLGPTYGLLDTYFGPALRLSLQSARVRGLPHEQESRYRAVWAAGVEAGARASLGRGWALLFSAVADTPLPWLRGRFLVQDQEVLVPSSVRFGVGVGLAYAFFQ